MVKYYRSVCPHDCPDACGLLVGVLDGRIVSVKGDPEHPFTRGFVCAKVNHYPQRIHSPDRLLYPLKRKGPKGSGKFRRIGWDEALSEIVDKYKDIMSKHGSAAILPYSYAGTEGVIQFHAGHAFFHQLGASKLNRTICGAAMEAGFAVSMGNIPTTDIESTIYSDLIIIWGSNTLTTNIHAWPFFQSAKKKGASIVVIDPYRNRTAARADRHVRIKPGTDAAMALGMMYVLLREDLIDVEFISNNTVGFEELKNRVAQYPLDRVEAITSVPAHDIESLALEYGRARAPYIRLGWGPSRQLNGGMAARTISLLPALVGALSIKGGGLTRSTSAAAKLNDGVLKGVDLAPPDIRTVNMVELGNALTELDDPPVKALHVYHSNPAVVAPDSNKVLAGMTREDLFVVVHEMFMTDTALQADLILPGASSMEVTDLYRSYGHYYVQMARPVIPPEGESRSALSVFRELAARFGFTDKRFAWSEEDYIAEILPQNRFFQGIDFNRLSLGDPIRLNVPDNPFENGFATPSGKIEFFSRDLEKRGIDPLPNGEPIWDPDGQGKYPFQLITPPKAQFLNSTFNEIPAMQNVAGPPIVMIHPDDAAPKGIADHSPVRVFNGRGEVFIQAWVTDDTGPGVLVVEGLYGSKYMPQGMGINRLTGQHLTDMGGGCAFHASLVDVQPWTGQV